MKLLLDTHAILGAGGASDSLPERVTQYLLDLENTLYVSSVSIWEIVSKNSQGKLPLPTSPSRWLFEVLRDLEAVPLAFEAIHAEELSKIDHFHRDPFDRMLICQARVERLAILTKDEAIRKYDVSTLW